MLQQMKCDRCGKVFTTERASARFCSTACRSSAYEARKRAPVELPPTVDDQETIEARTRADLVAGGRLATPLGAAAVRAARILDASSAVMGYAALMKQWQDTLETALAGAVVAADEVDELRALRDRKFAG